MRREPPPYSVMYMLFAGFGLSVLVGAIGGAVVFFASGQDPARQFLRSFTTDFRALMSLGIAIGASASVAT